MTVKLTNLGLPRGAVHPAQQDRWRGRKPAVFFADFCPRGERRVSTPQFFRYFYFSNSNNRLHRTLPPRIPRWVANAARLAMPSSVEVAPTRGLALGCFRREGRGAPSAGEFSSKVRYLGVSYRKSRRWPRLAKAAVRVRDLYPGPV